MPMWRVKKYTWMKKNHTTKLQIKSQEMHLLSMLWMLQNDFFQKAKWTREDSWFFCSNACSSWLRVVDKFEGFVLRREWKKQWILCWKHTKSGKEKKGCSATEELSIFDSISFRQTKICGSREEVVELKNKWFKLKARNDYKYKWQQWGCSWKFSVYLFFILLISLLLSMLPHLKHKRRD